jgi:hypothetical protein
MKRKAVHVEGLQANTAWTEKSYINSKNKKNLTLYFRISRTIVSLRFGKGDLHNLLCEKMSKLSVMHVF